MDIHPRDHGAKAIQLEVDALILLKIALTLSIGPLDVRTPKIVVVGVIPSEGVIPLRPGGIASKGSTSKE
jgi:hypothetical protein